MAAIQLLGQTKCAAHPLARTLSRESKPAPIGHRHKVDKVHQMIIKVDPQTFGGYSHGLIVDHPVNMECCQLVQTVHVVFQLAEKITVECISRCPQYRMQ